MRLMRALGRLAISAVILLLLLLQGAHSNRRAFFEKILREEISALLLKETRSDISIGAISGGWISDVRLHDLEIRSIGGIPQIKSLRIESAGIAFNPVAAAGGDPGSIESLVIENARIEIDLDRSGSDPAKADSAPPGPFPDLSAIRIPPAIIRNVSLAVRSGGVTLEIAGFNADSKGGPLSAATVSASWSAVVIDGFPEPVRLPAGSLGLSSSNGAIEARIESGGRERLKAVLTVPADGEVVSIGFETALEPWMNSKFGIRGVVNWPPGTGFSADFEASGVDAGAFPGIAARVLPRAGGTARFNGRLEGPDWDPRRMKGVMDASMQGASVAGVFLGDVEAGASLSEGLEAGVSVRALREGLALDLKASLDGAGNLGLSSSVKVPDLAGVLDGAPKMAIDGSLGFEGKAALSGRDWSVSGRLRSAWADLAGVKAVSADADFEASKTGVVVRRGTIERSDGRVECSGSIVPGSSPEVDFHASLRTDDLWELLPRAFVPEAGIEAKCTAEAGITAGGGGFAIRGSVRAGTVSVGGVEFRDLEALAEFSGRALSIEFLSAEAGGVRFRADSSVLGFGPDGISAGVGSLEFAWAGGMVKSGGPLSATASKDRISAAPFTLSGDCGDLALGFSVSREAIEGRLDLRCRDLRMIRGIIPGPSPEADGRMEAHVSVSGPLSDAGLRFRASLEGIRAGGFPEFSSRIEMDAGGGELRIGKADVRFDGGRAEISAAMPFRLDLEAPPAPGKLLDDLLSNPGFKAALSCVLDDAGSIAQAGWAGIVNPGGKAWLDATVRGPVEHATFEGQFTALNAGPPAFPVKKIRLRFRSEEGGVLIERGSVMLPFAEIRCSGLVPLSLSPGREADGRISFNPFPESGLFDMDFTCDEFEIEDLSKAFKIPEILSGMTGRCRFRLHAGGGWNSPVLTLGADAAALSWPKMSGECNSRISAAYADGMLDVEDAEISMGAARIEGRGRFPIGLGMDSISARRIIDPKSGIRAAASLRGFNPSVFSDAFPDLRTLSGLVEGRAMVSGTWEAPEVSIEAEISNGRVAHVNPAFPSVDGVNGRLKADGRQASFSVKGESSGGRISARSKVELSEGRVVSLTAEMKGEDGPLVLAGPPARVRADFDLRLAGTPESASLTGNVRVLGTRIDRRIDLSESSAGGGTVIPGFSLPGIGKVDLDVDVSTPEGVKVFSEIHQAGISVAGIFADVAGELKIKGVTEAPVLTGRISAREGYADLPFYRLNLVAASVKFSEEAPSDPEVSILGKTARGDSTIYVSVNGPLSGAEVAFRSDPPMPEEDIKVFLVTGVRPSDLRGSGAGEAMGVQLLQLVARQISPRLLGKEGGESILDRISIYSEKDSATREMTYSAGFRVFDWLYLVGEKDEYGYYNGKVTLKTGFKIRSERRN